MSYKRSELRKRVLRSLRGRDITMPASPGMIDEDQQFPLDITAVSTEKVRSLMSFWTGHLGYINSLFSRHMVDAMAYKREVRDYERRYKARNKSKSDRVWEIEAELADDSHYERLVNTWQEAEAMVTVLKSLRDAYEGYYNAASRELTARMGEQARDGSYRSGT